MANGFQPVLDEYLNADEFTFVYYNDELMLHDVKKQALKDMLLAIGSLIFIFCFILFHTR